MSMKPEHTIHLMIIGAQKSGTTSMLRYLGEHPELNSHPANEFSFFYDDEEYAKGFEHAYQDYFDKKHPGKIIAKHAHLYSSEKALQRLKEHNPECKIIFLLREPVGRTYSSYLMERLYNRVDFEFDELKEMLTGRSQKKLENWQKEAIIDFGYYDKYLKTVYSLFPKEQVRIILFDDFSADPLPVCQLIFKWLQVEPEFMPRIRTRHNETTLPRSRFFSNLIKNFLVRKNPVKEGLRKIIPSKTRTSLGYKLRNANRSGKDLPQMSDEMKSFLKSHFREHNLHLQELSGLNMSRWL